MDDHSIPASRVGRSIPRVAGIVVPLFSLRGVDDAGTGEILDLIPFIDWLQRWHQRIVQLLPINETAAGEASPYNTLSAFAIDPAYISVAQVPDVARSAPARSWLGSSRVQRQVRTWRAAEQRQRRAIYRFKLRLLEFGFQNFETLPLSSERREAFERFRQCNAWWLDDYALFRALKEQRRWTSWEIWPAPLLARDAVALRDAAATLRHRMRFFEYVQWIAAEQWALVRTHARKCGVLIKGDLPFVCGRDSADVWAHPELFDLSSSSGAPPDAFSSAGQAWGLPLYDWRAMRSAGYAWWRERARQARVLYDVFRVDHVVGLYRTYAIPVRDGGTLGFVPAGEDEQRVQGCDLMTAILEEAGEETTVIAEDLGTVPSWVRESLTQMGVLGYKVFRWEKHDGAYIDPRTYLALSVATSGTHDTETLPVWWNMLESDDRLSVVDSLGLMAVQADSACTPIPWSAQLHLALLQRLYEAGSALTILPIQDLFGWTERINTPATTHGDNWTYRLPVETTRLDDIPAIRERMQLLRDMIDDTGRNTLIEASTDAARVAHGL